MPQLLRFRAVSFGWASATALLGVLLLAAGCDNSAETLAELDQRGKRAMQGSQDHLAHAMQMIEHVEDYNQQQASSLILTQLGQWIEDQPPDVKWTADALAAKLPANATRELSLNQFIGADYLALRETVWMRNIARWQEEELRQRTVRLQDEAIDLESEIRTLAGPAAGKPDSAEKLAQAKRQLEAVQLQLNPPCLAGMQAAMKNEQAYEDLALTVQLFDWTVRNIQLLPTHWDAKMPEATRPADQPEKPASTDKNQPTVPPAGAEYQAWEALLLGQADAATRARIFVLLARQAKIDVVLLGIPPKKPEDEPRVWAAAAIINDQLYLFDLELGLPIPGPQGQGICTFAQLKANPELLKQLDASPQQPYLVTSKDVENSIGMIDATPDYLSQRMKMIEDNLRSEQRLVLTVQPSLIAAKLRKLGIKETRVWLVPYRAYVYANIRHNYDPPAQNEFNERLSHFTSPVVSRGPLLSARLYHFRGELDAKQDRLGARAFYLKAREPDVNIKKYTAANLFGDEARPAEQQKFQADYAEMIQRIVIASKRQSTFWLGVVAAEEQQLATAVDFLENRVLKLEPDSPWADGARYNLARAYEASGETQKAIALYEQDQSPQRHGNLLRAKWLKAAAGSASPTQDAPQTDDAPSTK